MDFRLSTEQQALRDGMRAFCDARVPHERLPELADTGGFDRSLWSQLSEMGVFHLRQPDGLGLGMADAALIFAELGRRLVPGPVVWTHLASGRIEGAANGTQVVGGLDLDDVTPRPCLIEHHASLNVLLLLRPDGLYRVDPKALAAEPIATSLDPLTPLHQVAQLPEGERIGGGDDADQLRLEGATLVAAQLLGITEATLELARAFAMQREQFGRAIGSFQAIKHMLADMFVRQEVARAAVYAAGATFGDPSAGDIRRAVSAAKLIAGEAAMKNARACIQIHGGMGFTWEIPAHYYLKRTWVLESVFGTVEQHADRVADILGANARTDEG